MDGMNTELINNGINGNDKAELQLALRTCIDK